MPYQRDQIVIVEEPNKQPWVGKVYQDRGYDIGVLKSPTHIHWALQEHVRKQG